MTVSEGEGTMLCGGVCLQTVVDVMLCGGVGNGWGDVMWWCQQWVV